MINIFDDNNDFYNDSENLKHNISLILKQKNLIKEQIDIVKNEEEKLILNEKNINNLK